MEDWAGRKPEPKGLPQNYVLIYIQGLGSTPSVIPTKKSECHLPLHGEGTHNPMLLQNIDRYLQKYVYRIQAGKITYNSDSYRN